MVKPAGGHRVVKDTPRGKHENPLDIKIAFARFSTESAVELAYSSITATASTPRFPFDSAPSALNVI